MMNAPLEYIDLKSNIFMQAFCLILSAIYCAYPGGWSLLGAFSILTLIYLAMLQHV